MKRITICVLMLVAIFGLYGGRSAVTHAQDNTIEFITFHSGQFSALLIDGNIAYAGEMDGLTIFDVSNPETPTLLGRIALPARGYEVRDIEVVGSIAYLTHGANGLLTVDVADPSSPVLIGSYDPDSNPNEYDENGYFLGSAGSVEVVNNVAYIADGYNGMVTVDVTDPSNMTHLSTYGAITSNHPFPQEGEPVNDVAVAGSIAYVTKGSEGLLVLDISDPTMPTLLTEYMYGEYENLLTDIEISDTIVYVYDVMIGIVMLDISNPTMPSLIGTAVESIEVSKFIVINDLMYVTLIDRFSVVDVSDKGNPTVLVTHEVSPQFSNGIGVGDGTIYMTGESGPPQDISGLYVYNYTSTSSSIPTPENTVTPVPETSFGLLGAYAGNVTAISIQDTVAYIGVASDEENPDTLLPNNYLEIVDVVDPTSPVLIGKSDVIPSRIEDIAVVGGIAYVVTLDEMSTFDVSNPAEPILLDSYSMGASFHLQVVENIAYVADNFNGFVLLDVSNPSDITQIASYTLSGFPNGMQIIGTTAYLTIDVEGLLAIDVSDSADLIELSMDNFNGAMGYPQGLYVVENTAYVIDDGDGLIAVNVGDPATPALLDSIGSGDGSYDVVVSQSAAYVFGSPDGLSVFDVSAPNQPVFLESYGEFGGIDTSDVQVVGNLMYIADGSKGLQILTLDGIPDSHIPTPTVAAPVNVPTSVVPTYTPTPSPTPMLPPAVPTSTSIPDGDGYENDDVCGEARTILSDGTSQQHTFDAYGDVDWIEFEAVDGVMYQIVAEAVGQSAADLVAEVYPDCETAYQVEQSHSFAPSVILNVTARQDGMYKVRFYNADPAVFGDNVAYRVSVTEVLETNIGAVVIIGGRDGADDHLQDNIHDVTNRVYKMFAQNGYSESRIHYLATDFTPNDDPDVVVDGEATAANLQDIITNQLFNQVSDQQPLTIYMMSHGFATGGFYLDEVNNERVLPAELDAWLDQLQENRPGVEINIIIDACYAGQFISNDLGETISGENRVVITSSANNELAWSSFNGANFSDYFLVGIHQRKTIYEAFEAARWAISRGHTVQHAWIDDNEDGLPNSFNDGAVAAERYLLSPDGSFGTTWEPYIESVVVDGIGDMATIQARVLFDPDGMGVEQVQAVLYPPSFEPDVNGDRLLTMEGLSAVELTLAENGWYIGNIQLDELGQYEVSVHAQGNTPANLDVSLQAQPVIQTFTNNTGDNVIIPLSVDRVETTLESPFLSLGAIVIVFSTLIMITPRLLKR